MKKLKYLAGCLSAAFLAFLSAGCTDMGTLAEQESMKITADAGSWLGTRSQIDPESRYGITGILWSPGDKIGVFGGSAANAVFTAENTVASASATFKGNATGVPQYAYYPYAETAGNSADKVVVTLASGQSYTGAASIADNDIKVADRATKQPDGTWRFAFRPVAALLRFSVDASSVDGIDTAEKLTEIHVTASDETRALSGVFNIDLTDGSSSLVPVAGETSAKLIVTLPAQPVLAGKVEAYACVVPAVKRNDELLIDLYTDSHKISFTVKAEQDLQAGCCYDIPFVLSHATEENGLTVEDVETVAEPRLLSFEFPVKGNEGKILDKEAYYSSTGTATRSVSEMKMTVSDLDSNDEWQDKGSVTGCIPYLYDFTLTPSFSVSAGAVVKVNGEVQTSGESTQDFSSPVTYTVTNTEGVSRDYVVTVTNSGLPVVVLTDGGDASDDPQGDLEFLGMTVRSKNSAFVNTDKIAVYDKAGGRNLAEAACGFRLRGNSTQGYPKKPLAIKLDKKASVLGMPTHKRWVLLASWIDRSLIRNAVAFDIAKTVQDAFVSTPDADGHYGSEGTDGLVWNPGGENVELVLNGVHVGNYLLAEQIKIDKNRLAIQDGYEDVHADYVEKGEAEPSASNCGYLLEFDDNYDEPTKFITSKCYLPCMSKDDMTDGGTSIWKYVTDYVQDIENNLMSGYYTAAYEKLDINSVIDYWFVQELTMNDEFKHPKSVYMYKNGEGKLYAGPVWDFDWQTFPEISKINSFGGPYTLSYNYNTLLYTQYKHGSSESGYRTDCPYMWYPLLFKDQNFVQRVKERWAVVYPKLGVIANDIRELGAKNRVSDIYNKAMWPAESYERSNWGISVAFSGDERLATYDEVIEQMASVYNKRLEAMNTAISNLK